MEKVFIPKRSKKELKKWMTFRGKSGENHGAFHGKVENHGAELRGFKPASRH